MAMPGSGAPMGFHHVQPLGAAVGYGPAVVGGTASRIKDVNGRPKGLGGDPAG